MTDERARPGLVIGTAQLGTAYGVANTVGAIDDKTAVRLVRTASERGALAFDTAPGYGSSERLIGRAGVGTPVFTKLTPGVGPEESVDGSLARLRRKRLDLLQIHDESQLDDPRLLRRLRAQVGVNVTALGASVYGESAFRLVLDDDAFEYVQVPASVADRRFTGAELDAAHSAGRKVLVRSVFLQGALLLAEADVPAHLAALVPLLRALDTLASGSGLSRPELLFTYVRDLPNVEGVIVGVETLHQLDEAFLGLHAPPLDSSTRAALDGLPSVPDDVADPRCWPPPNRRSPSQAARG